MRLTSPPAALPFFERQGENPVLDARPLGWCEDQLLSFIVISGTSHTMRKVELSAPWGQTRLPQMRVTPTLYFQCAELLSTARWRPLIYITFIDCIIAILMLRQIKLHAIRGYTDLALK
jgi:hypothetical protein